jgi:hypothetical protein
MNDLSIWNARRVDNANHRAIGTGKQPDVRPRLAFGKQ